MDGATWELVRGVDFHAGIASFRNRCYGKATETGMNATVNIGFEVAGEWKATKDYDEQLVIADPQLRRVLEAERERRDLAWYGTLTGPDGVVVWARDPAGDLFAAPAASIMQAVAGAELAQAQADQAQAAYNELGLFTREAGTWDFVGDDLQAAIDDAHDVALLHDAARDAWDVVNGTWGPEIPVTDWAQRFPDTPEPPPLVVKVRFFVQTDAADPAPPPAAPVAA